MTAPNRADPAVSGEPRAAGNSAVPGDSAVSGEPPVGGSAVAAPLLHLRHEASGRALATAEITILLVMLFWGVNVVAVKAAINEFPPIAFAFVRFALAFLLMLGLLRWREGTVAIPRREILPLFALGFVGFGIYQDLWATALRQTTAANSALITSATPIPTMLIAAAIGADLLSARKVTGALVSLAGVLVVVVATHGISFSGAGLGDLMTVIATICWASYVAFGAPILARHSALRATTWAAGFGCLGMLPLALPQLATLDFSQVHVGTYALLAYSAFVAAAVSNVLMFRSVRVLGPSRVTLFQFFVPVFAVVAAFIFLGEPLAVGQVAGGAVILGGILVARSRPRPARASGTR